MSNLQDHIAEQEAITAACEAGTCDHPECHESDEWFESTKLTDADAKRIAERTYTYEDIRVAFSSGYCACQDHEDHDDAWNDHREFLASFKDDKA
jgi:hypothetical protein